METAILAAGCFWGVQYYFDQVPGIKETRVGYIGGRTKNPTYEQVCSHTTGHAEAIRIYFHPEQVSYETLLRHFFRIHDPTQLNRQGPDVGDNYRSAIFYLHQEQKDIASRIIDELNSSTFDGKIVTTVEEAGQFWLAEDYHQLYAERTGRGMCHVSYEAIEA